MPLRRSNIDVPAGGGLAQKQDLRDYELTSAAAMTNCVRQKNNAVRKRFGNQFLASTSGELAGGSYKGAPWVSNGSGMATYSDQSGAASVIDAHPEAVAGDRLGLAAWLSTPFDWDMASGNGAFVVVMTGDTTDPSSAGAHALYWAAIDAATNATIVPMQKVQASMTAGAYAPKLAVCGTTLVLTYVKSTASTSLTFRTLSLTAITSGWSTETDVNLSASGNFTSGVYDMCAVAGDTAHVAVAYEYNNSAAGVAIATVTITGTPTVNVGHTAGDTGTTNLTNIAINASTTNGYWIAYSGTKSAASVLRVVAFTPVFAVVTAATVYTWTLGSGVATGRADVIYAGGNILVVWSPSLSGATDYFNVVNAFVSGVNVANVAGAVTTTSSVFTNYGVLLYSRSVVPGPGAAPYFAVLFPSSTQGTVFLVRCDWVAISSTVPLAWVCTFDPRLTKYIANMMPAFGTTPTGMSAPHIVPDPTVDTFAYAVPVPENTSVKHSALYAQRFDLLTSSARLSNGELYELEALSLGVPSVLDGQSIVELGYAHYPEVTLTVQSGSGLSVGVYSYILIWEWYDDRGQIHRSATSPAQTVTTTSGNQKVLVTNTTLALTNRRALFNQSTQKSLPYRVIYRTTAGGTIYYRLTPNPPASGDQVTFAGSSLSYTDTAADSTITSNELLYTTGGTLDNYCPPSARICIVHRNRWWLAGTPDPTALWASKYLTTGECPGFNELQNTTCTGAIRALASLDEKLVIFVQRGSAYGIEYMTGDGPFDTGAQSDWTPPQQIPSPSGAVDQRGVCSGPFGVLFRGTVGGPNNSGGIFLLGRDMQVSYLSGPVEDTLAAYPYVTSMVLHPRNGRVYITCVTTPALPSVTTGVRLVWDYIQGGVWSTDTLNDVPNSQPQAGATCAWVANAANVGPSYYWVSGGGAIYREYSTVGANAFTDDGAWIPMTYASGFVRPSKAGFARFWGVQVLADALETAGLTVQLTFDEAPSSYYSENFTWTAAQTSAFDRAPQVQVKMVPANQKAQSMQITVTDVAPVSFTTGQGLSLDGFAIDIGSDPGSYPNVPAGQRA